MGARSLVTAPTRGRRRLLQGLVALAVAAVPFVIAVPAAWAGVGLGVTPTFPVSVTVGATNVPASLQIQNTATAPDNVGNTTVSAVTLVASCGTTNPTATGDCPAAKADPNVFTLSATGTGAAGTACAAVTFTIAVIDAATGQVSITAPVATPISLAPTGASSICTIDFTVDVRNSPTNPAAVIGPNSLQTDQIAEADATGPPTGVGTHTGLGIGSSLLDVLKAQPGIVTTATTAAALGGAISDTATLSAAVPPGPTPTGTITFNAYGPADATCANAPPFTSVVPVNLGAANYSSGPFTPAAVGTYRWIAAYSGDANNAAATTACNDNGEVSTVNAPGGPVAAPPAAPVVAPPIVPVVAPPTTPATPSVTLAPATPTALPPAPVAAPPILATPPGPTTTLPHPAEILTDLGLPSRHRSHVVQYVLVGVLALLLLQLAAVQLWRRRPTGGHYGG